MSNDIRWNGFQFNEAQVDREIRRTTRRQARRRVRRSLLILLCVAIGFGMLLKWALIGAVSLEGDGMQPTLRGGETVLYLHSLPISGTASVKARTGELALVSSFDGQARHHVVRRVIAREGDEVFVDATGRITVNDALLDEPYATYRTGVEDVGGGLLANPFALDEPAQEAEERDPRWEETSFPLTVPEGRLFVMADDRNTFSDSRSQAFGLVRESDMLGLPWAVIWPSDRIRLLADFRLENHLEELDPIPQQARPATEPAGEGTSSVLQ